ncbi:MAG: hypothetical protein ACKO3N_18480 [Verrucomicrobiota bacterium]
MDLTKLSADHFKRILRLLEEKEAHLAKVARIDEELQALGGEAGAKAPVSPRKPAARAPRKAEAGGVRRKRGELQGRILSLLQGAGAPGLTVKEIAQRLEVPGPNVHAWFGSTGKKFPQLQVVDGRRVWVEQAPAHGDGQL